MKSTPTRPAGRSFRLVSLLGLGDAASAPSAETFSADVDALLAAEGFESAPEPFHPLCRRAVREPFALGESLAAFFGLIYIMDRSSMLPPLALAPPQGASVLDVCSAPGSKTGLLASLIGPDGFVLANEPGRDRRETLAANLRRQGFLHVMTCSRPGEALGLADESFDHVLLDPPCSGWGTIEKNPQAAMWTEDKSRPLERLQRELLASAARICAPGGTIVYSTCTTRPAENQEQAAHARDELGLEIEPLAPFPGFVFTDPGERAPGTLLVDGAASGAQGFYIARLRKPARPDSPARSPDLGWSPPGKPLDPRLLRDDPILRAGGSRPGRFMEFSGVVCRLPEQAFDRLPAGFQARGAAVGRLSREGFRPDPRARGLVAGLPPEHLAETLDCPRLVVDDANALKRLISGGSLTDEGTLDPARARAKRAVLCWRDTPLGFVSLKNGRALWAGR